MVINISKKDVSWNYIVQFFNLGSGFIVLPAVLHLLSSDEVGMNYLMLSISSLMALADFGFSSQFGRNITYVFSGAQKLEKEGINDSSNGEINYYLLSIVIETAKFIYRRISLFVLFTMLTFGSVYMYSATDGFSTVNNSFVIWLLFSLSTYFNMYFLYYNSLLTGAALIMESKKAILLNRITYIVLAFLFLFMNCGLISVVIANFISPFVGRWYSYRKFYSPEIKIALTGMYPKKEEIKNMFGILWYNAKKLGINFLGAYGIQQSGTFIIGLFLSLKEVASYGLMCQLFQVSTALSTGLFSTLLPVFYKERVEKNTNKLIRLFSLSEYVYFVLFFVCGGVILFCGDFILDVIGSKTKLPTMVVTIIYFLHILLENFHSMCASMIVTNNQVPFVKAAIISGLCIVISNFLSLKFTSWGIMGVVIWQLVIQSIYNHWKWPAWILRELNINLFEMMRIGHAEFCYNVKRVIKN